METVKIGDKVKVHYTGKLNDGKTFDSSEGREPLEFTIGENQVLKMFEESVVGLEVGKSTKIQIPAAEAYGTRNEDLVLSIPNDRMPENLTLEVGMKLQTQSKDGQVMIVKITEIGETQVNVDANHELADEDLQFEIKLVEIVQK